MSQAEPTIEELQAIVNAQDTAQPSEPTIEELQAIVNPPTQTKSFKPPTNLPAGDTNAYLEADGFKISEAPFRPDLFPKEAETFVSTLGDSLSARTAIPISSAVKAAVDVALTDKTVNEFNNLRRSYQDTGRAQLAELKLQNPSAAFAGDFVGTTALVAATGGTGVLAQAGVGGAVAGTDAFFSTANPKAKDVLISGLLGAGGGLGGPVGASVGRGIAEQAEKVSIRQAFGGFSNGMADKLNQWARKFQTNKEEAFDMLLDTVDSKGRKLVSIGQDPEVTLAKLRDVKSDTWDSITSFLKNAETYLGPNAPKIQGGKVMADLDAMTLRVADNSTSTEKAYDEASAAARWAKSELDNRDFSLSELNIKIKMLDSELDYNLIKDELYKKEAVNYAKNMLDNAIDQIPELYTSKELKGLKKKYGLFADVEAYVQKNVARQSAFFPNLKEMMAGVSLGTLTHDPAYGIAAMVGTMAWRNDSVRGATGAVLRRVGDALQTNPERWGKAVQGLVIAARGEHKDFDNEMAYVDANIQLSGNPVKRTKEDLLAKKDLLLSVLYKHDSTMADNLSEALSNYDYGTAGLIFEQVAKNPKLNFVIEKGIGFDGKLSDENDKRTLMTEMTSGESGRKLTTAQKLDGFKALKNGTIPQLGKAAPAGNLVSPALQNVIKTLPKKKELPY